MKQLISELSEYPMTAEVTVAKVTVKIDKMTSRYGYSRVTANRLAKLRAEMGK